MARTGFIKFGSNTYSNFNLSVGIEPDLFVSNFENQPNGTWRRRRGKTIIRNIGNPIDTIFFDTTRQQTLIVSRDKIFLGEDVIFEGKDISDLTNFSESVYFISEEVVYQFNGIDVLRAKYRPNKVLISPNAISITSGSPIASILIENHNLTVGQFITLDSFTTRMGGQDLNQEVEVTSIIDSNNIQVTYPQNFTETIDSSGGNGIITAVFPEEDFPNATSITAFRSRLYLSKNQTLYVSSLSLPDKQDVRFAEKYPEEIIDTKDTTGILNMGYALNIDQPYWVNIGDETDGKIKTLHSALDKILIFKEKGVYATEGIMSSPVQKVLSTDTVVNKKAVATSQYATYFMGYNSFYRITNKIEPLGDPHDYYIKNKENDRVVVETWDNQVFCVLGDFERLELDSDIPSLMVKDLALIFRETTSTYYFFENFAPNDMEKIVDEDKKLHLYLDSDGYLCEYIGIDDLGKNIETTIITHPKYFSKDVVQKKKFAEFYLFGRRLVNVNLFYKVQEETGWQSAKGEKDTDHNMIKFSLEKNNSGRGIQFMLKSITDSQYLELHGYVVDVKTAV